MEGSFTVLYFVLPPHGMHQPAPTTRRHYWLQHALKPIEIAESGFYSHDSLCKQDEILVLNDVLPQPVG